MTTTNRELVAGGTDGTSDFMRVWHLTATGSQADIGHALAIEAQRTYGWQPAPADPVIARARRRWFERNWPQHHARMVGAAEAMGIDLTRDQVHLDGLTGVPDGSACSVTWNPPTTTVDGHGLVGRNYDFFTTGAAQLFAMLAGESTTTDEAPMASRPYVLTSVPDDGPATTVITMNELDGCMEGINEHGLAVALLIADVETTRPPVAAGPQVGLSSVQLPRFVLDTCTNVEEAKQASLMAKQYDLGVPLHYLIADASGNAFVWERGAGGVEYTIDADGGPICVTNHLLHRYPDPERLPTDNAETMHTFERLGTLTKRTNEQPMSAATVRAVLDEVRYDATMAGELPLRTLWRTVFDVADRTMSTHFYLGDDESGAPRYSKERTYPRR